MAWSGALYHGSRELLLALLAVKLRFFCLLAISGVTHVKGGLDARHLNCFN